MVQGLIYSIALFFMSSCGHADDGANSVSADYCVASVASTENEIVKEMSVPTDRFIVKPRHRGGLQAAVFAQDAQVAAVEALDSEVVLMKTAVPTTAEELKAKLADDEIEFVEPDYLVQHTALSNDEYVSKQWAHAKVHSAEAWRVNRGAGVVVAVIDSGVDYNHEDLRANMWVNRGEIPGNGIDDDRNGYRDDIYGWNFVADNGFPKTEVGGSNHGTHVAGTIGAVANNREGIAGHAPGVKIMALKFLGKNGSGFTSDAVKAIDYAIRNGAKVINNSWGAYSKSMAVSQAIDRARAAGVLFVAAAGNSGANNDGRPFFPASFPQDNVIRVASSTSGDGLSSFSNYGGRTVDIAAPGSNIYSTVDGNRYSSKSGTSMAAPLVSGVVATLISARPDFNYRQIRGALFNSVDKLSAFQGRVRTGGRVNAYRALTAVNSLPSDWQPPALGFCQ